MLLPVRPSGKKVRYTSVLSKMSREAYKNAPERIRMKLDVLNTMPNFVALAQNQWTGSVQAVDRKGAPLEFAQSYLDAHPEIKRWVMQLKPRAWMPTDVECIWLDPDEAEALGE